MIRYAKSSAIPSSLRRGGPATAADCADYDRDPGAYRSGAKSLDIQSRIYGTEVVKRSLKADQHNKCAFCEAIFDANVAGDVEHYRPKGAIKTDTTKLLPGYYWLGYEWSNLSYACPDCNQYRKRDRFPLADESRRARDHHHDVAQEEPLLLDPYGTKDPRHHIVFRGEVPVHATVEGETTIKLLALGRTALARDRLRHLQHLTALAESIELLKDDPRPQAADYVARSRAQIAAAVGPAAKFSAAASDHLAALAAGSNRLPTIVP